MTIVTADIYDMFHEQLLVCDLQFRSFGRNSSFVGKCATVTAFDDHTPVLRALSEAGHGRVLVVDGGGSLRVGLMGDRLASIAVDNGWTGLVVNGAIRDSLGINALPIGVKALGTTARRGLATAATERDAPVTFGDARFTAGDWIYADTDCVLVSATELDLAKLQTVAPQ